MGTDLARLAVVDGAGVDLWKKISRREKAGFWLDGASGTRLRKRKKGRSPVRTAPLLSSSGLVGAGSGRHFGWFGFTQPRDLTGFRLAKIERQADIPQGQRSDVGPSRGIAQQQARSRSQDGA
jgi:hypothetical protein